MKLAEAEAYAQNVVDCIKHLCDPGKVMVVGSIRRRRPEVNDIDIVCIPQAWMWHMIKEVLVSNLHMEEIREGNELLSLGFSEVDLPVDIYRARPETWGVLLLIRTGSIQHNIKLCSRAKAMGLKLSAKEGVVQTIQSGCMVATKVIACYTEEEIFKALGMEYVEPENRE